MRAISVSLESTEAAAAVMQQPGKQLWEECCLFLWLLQHSCDLHPSVGHSGSSKSPLLQGFKRQLDKSMEEISTEAIKSKVLLLVKESPTWLIVGQENCYCVIALFFHISFDYWCCRWKGELEKSLSCAFLCFSTAFSVHSSGMATDPEVY